ncbi:hypothetical protein MMC13_005592 [Lambiella insularis]|nr:hypothetical protein [Lambiella insularis]
MSTPVLSARDINTSAPHPAPAVDSKDAAKSMEYHRQMLQSKLADDGQKTTYISPSDTIMSPTTQKLAGMRQKRILKGSKPQSLFAKTSSKNMLSPQSTASSTSGLDGVISDSMSRPSEPKDKA